MLNVRKSCSGVLFVCAAGLAVLAPSQAWAWGGHHDRGYAHSAHYPHGRVSFGLPHSSISIGFSGRRYYYSEGLFYAPRHRDYVVVPPPTGVLVTAIPQGYQVTTPPPAVVVDPVVVAEPEPQQFTVNIPGPGTRYTTVIVKRSGTGFTGPQGEFYSEFPQVAQLKAMYVK